MVDIACNIVAWPRQIGVVMHGHHASMSVGLVHSATLHPCALTKAATTSVCYTPCIIKALDSLKLPPPLQRHIDVTFFHKDFEQPPFSYVCIQSQIC